MAPPEIVKATTNTTTGVENAASNCGQRRAYVTFLAGNGDYVKGVVGLAKGLRKVQTAYPLVVAVLPDVPVEHRSILVSQGCILREIEPVQPPKSQNRFARDYYVINYSKLRLWEFEEYRKMIYLDGDIQVFDNIDHLFDLPYGYFYAVMDCLCDGLPLSQQCPERLQWPTELGPRPYRYFNAGMFVFEPSLSTYADLFKTFEVTPLTAFAEQDFLNMYFRETYQPIPPMYNFLLAMLWRHPENIEVEKVKVVHYCIPGSKPWKYSGKEKNLDRVDVKMLVKKWWNIYNDRTLDYKSGIAMAENGGEAEAESDKKLTVVQSEAGSVGFMAASSAA